MCERERECVCVRESVCVCVCVCNLYSIYRSFTFLALLAFFQDITGMTTVRQNSITLFTFLMIAKPLLLTCVQIHRYFQEA